MDKFHSSNGSVNQNNVTNPFTQSVSPSNNSGTQSRVPSRPFDPSQITLSIRNDGLREFIYPEGMKSGWSFRLFATNNSDHNVKWLGFEVLLGVHAVSSFRPSLISNRRKVPVFGNYWHRTVYADDLVMAVPAGTTASRDYRATFNFAHANPQNQYLGTTLYRSFGALENGQQFYQYHHPQLMFSPKGVAQNYGCFPFNASVHTPNGEMSIGKIKRGDVVHSWNRSKKALVARPVNKVIEYSPKQIWEVCFEDSKASTLAVTKTHALLTAQGWKDVSQLNEGDLLTYVEGAKSQMAKVKHVAQTNRVEPVYDLITAREHNYIVGTGIVARNFSVSFNARTVAQSSVEMSQSRGHPSSMQP